MESIFLKKDDKIKVKKNKKNILPTDTDTKSDILNDISDEDKLKNKKVKKYDTKVYNATFYIKNKDKISEKITCSVCCGNYTYFNKSKHFKSDKHTKIANKYNLI